jgi:L-threonylcarbamoyladenylate synthase
MDQRKTQVVTVDPDEPDPQAIQRAADIVRDGGLVVIPTDTVYGLVCDPRQPEAVQQIYRVKGRRRDQPLALLLHDMSQVSASVEHVPELAVRAMQHFWPGALTVVVRACPARDRSDATAAVRARKNTVGLRLPAHVVPRLVAHALGSPLASTSANRSGQPAPTTAEQARDQLQGLIELVLDAGPTPTAHESTVVDFSRQPPRVLRPGAIPVQRLRELLGDVQDS